MYLLDTNVCIRFLQGRSDNLLNRFNSVSAQEKCIFSIVAAELLYGAAKSQRKQDTLNQLGKFMACFRFLLLCVTKQSRIGTSRAT